MARTTEEIYESLVAEKEAEPALAALTSTSRTAIWRLLLHIVAVCANTLEKITDLHKRDVDAQIAGMKPHTLRWYVSKAKLFQYGDHVNDLGEYDVTDENLRIVKHASATESSVGNVILKVAKNGPAKLSNDELARFRSYISEVKDAGVVVNIATHDGDWYACSADILYDPECDADTVKGNCISAIKAYITGLPFNGEYSNMAAVDALQAVDGVEIVSNFTARGLPHASNAAPEYNDLNPIGAATYGRTIPQAGFFKVLDIDNEEQINLNLIPHEI